MRSAVFRWLPGDNYRWKAASRPPQVSPLSVELWRAALGCYFDVKLKIPILGGWESLNLHGSGALNQLFSDKQVQLFVSPLNYVKVLKRKKMESWLSYSVTSRVPTVRVLQATRTWIHTNYAWEHITQEICYLISCRYGGIAGKINTKHANKV